MEKILPSSHLRADINSHPPPSTFRSPPSLLHFTFLQNRPTLQHQKVSIFPTSWASPPVLLHFMYCPVSFHVLSYFAFCPVLSCFISCTVLSCPVSYHVLSCPVLYHVLSHFTSHLALLHPFPFPSLNLFATLPAVSITAMFSRSRLALICSVFQCSW